jgi:polyhydroxyalkanoate synthase
MPVWVALESQCGDAGFGVVISFPGGASVVEKESSLDTALSAFRCFQFSLADFVRRQQGQIFGALGLDPVESPYRITASGAFWRLRDYSELDTGQPLLVVAAPIKRPYIWDLTPSTSAIRNLLGQGFRVQLLEWLPASQATSMNGLEEYTDAISECMAKISSESGGVKALLAGHSLGGTLAAVFAALKPEVIQGLVLLSAPLCFQPETSRFRDALVTLVPPGLVATAPFPGSLLSHMSAMAAPDTFIWSRLKNAVISTTDNHALEIHARVERWALDEVPLPGKLVFEIIEWLYRGDRLSRGDLTIGGKRIGPLTLSAPALAVVDAADEIAPIGAVKPFIDAMPREGGRLVEFPGESGVPLQHLAILIGRKARETVWPEIISWMRRTAQRH